MQQLSIAFLVPLDAAGIPAPGPRRRVWRIGPRRCLRPAPPAAAIPFNESISLQRSIGSFSGCGSGRLSGLPSPRHQSLGPVEGARAPGGSPARPSRDHGPWRRSTQTRHKGQNFSRAEGNGGKVARLFGRRWGSRHLDLWAWQHSAPTPLFPQQVFQGKEGHWLTFSRSPQAQRSRAPLPPSRQVRTPLPWPQPLPLPLCAVRPLRHLK